jgi:Ca-activated chloride channel family protein
MRRGHAALAVTVAFIAVSTTAMTAQHFKSGTLGVRVDVLVTKGQQLVRGLDAGDFELRDNGVVQSVSEVEIERIPLNLILVFDTSTSVAGERMRFLLQAGDALLDELRSQDRAAFLSFASRVRLLAPLTPSREQIRGALSTLEAKGATSLRDAAFAGLAMREDDPGRTLVLIFSDGEDTSSWLKMSDVLESAKRTDAVVYAVALAERRYGVSLLNSTGEVKHAGKFLDNLTEESGGRVIFANSNSDLRATFTRALAEFRDRYVLSYSPTGVSNTGWHRLEVKLKNKSGKVTARRGYFAE